MARSGKFAANMHLIGFNRNDPFPRKLRRLKSIRKRENLIYRAMGRAAKPMRDAMESNSPVRTGVLSQSFRIRKLKKTPRFVFGIRVGAVSGPRVVGPDQLGYIAGVSKGDTYQMAGWRDHFAELGTVNHGAHPHIAPAIQQHLTTYQRQVRLEINQAIAALVIKG